MKLATQSEIGSIQESDYANVWTRLEREREKVKKKNLYELKSLQPRFSKIYTPNYGHSKWDWIVLYKLYKRLVVIVTLCSLRNFSLLHILLESEHDLSIASVLSLKCHFDGWILLEFFFVFCMHVKYFIYIFRCTMSLPFLEAF